MDDAGQTLIYNAWDELIAVNNTAGTTVALYTYDGMGQRVTKTDNGGPQTVMYYDAGDQLVEQDVAKSGLALQAQYVWDAGVGYQNALVLRDYDFTDNGAFQVNERDYALQDADWNVTALVGYTTVIGDANADGTVDNTDLVILLTHFGQTVAGGAAVGDYNDDGVVNNTDLTALLTHYTETGVGTWTVVSRIAYSPYGVATYYTPTFGAGDNFLAWNVGFQGMLYDSTTGDNFADDRIYRASMGRWLTEDPSGLSGVNPYWGLADNPINWVDPSGLAAGEAVADQGSKTISILGAINYGTLNWNVQKVANASGGQRAQLDMSFTPGQDCKSKNIAFVQVVTAYTYNGNPIIGPHPGGIQKGQEQFDVWNNFEPNANGYTPMTTNAWLDHGDGDTSPYYGATWVESAPNSNKFTWADADAANRIGHNAGPNGQPVPAMMRDKPGDSLPGTHIVDFETFAIDLDNGTCYGGISWGYTCVMPASTVTLHPVRYEAMPSSKEWAEAVQRWNEFAAKQNKANPQESNKFVIIPPIKAILG